MITLLFLSALAHAALPPGAESLRRLAAVAESPEVFAKIGSARWVKSISDNGNGTYTVATQSCRLYVKVEASVNPNGPIGPSVLKVFPGNLNCRRQAH